MNNEQLAHCAQITPNELIRLFWEFVEQRPNLETGNYSDYRSYRNEQARITRQLHNARKELGRFTRLIALDNGKLNAEALENAFHAFSGRLSLEKKVEVKTDTKFGLLPRFN